MATPIDYYNSGSIHRGDVIGASGSFNFMGAQSFIASSGYDIASVKLLLYKDGTPGTITVGIYAVDGSGFPTGSALAEGTINGNDLTTDTDGEWVEITFVAAYTLTNGIQYIIVASAAGYKARWNVHNGAGGYSNGKWTYRTKDVNPWYFPNSSNDDGFFETYGVLPGAPTNPSPGIDATGITLDESPLSWDASSPAADTYEIYFREQGEAWGDPIGVAQAGVEYVLDFGYIDYEKTYEWRVDATNAVGTTTGTTWTFGSIVFDSPSPGTGGGGGGTGEESSPTGENNMITLRRLVVAVEDKIWYEDI